MINQIFENFSEAIINITRWFDPQIGKRYIIIKINLAENPSPSSIDRKNSILNKNFENRKSSMSPGNFNNLDSDGVYNR